MQSIQEIITNSQIPRLDTRVLLSHVTGFNATRLITHDDYILTTEQQANYVSLVQRAIAGEPIAYLIGYREFYGRNFKVTTDTLIPRPETELMIEEALRLAPEGAKLIDLGTGSGAIAITTKLERPDIDVAAVDKFIATLTVAQENASLLKAKISFIKSDWFTNITDKFDIIISNPPYIESHDQHLLALGYEPQHALTDFADGLTHIRSIVQQSTLHILNGGWLLIEHGYNQKQQVQEIFIQHKFNNIMTKQDYANLDRYTIGQYFIEEQRQ